MPEPVQEQQQTPLQNTDDDGFPDDIVDRDTGRPLSDEVLVTYNGHKAVKIWQDPDWVRLGISFLHFH